MVVMVWVLMFDFELLLFDEFLVGFVFVFVDVIFERI